MLLGVIKNLNQKFIIVISICGCYTLSSCDQNTHLSPVTYGQFEAFINDTGYITDAERYGWSIVQSNVFDFTTVEGAIWRRPDGEHPVESSSLPVTQVSYNDAIAYCKWANTRLPTYAEYWRLVKDDHRPIVSDNIGGSLFCSEATCDGTVSDRELSVDRETGNVHIGFSVVEVE